MILLPSQVPFEAVPEERTVEHSAILTEPLPAWMIDTQPQSAVRSPRPRPRKHSNPPTWLADLIAERPLEEHIPIWLRKTQPLNEYTIQPRITLPFRRKRGA